MRALGRRSIRNGSKNTLRAGATAQIGYIAAVSEPILIHWRTAELWRRLAAKGVDIILSIFLLPLVSLGIQMAFSWHNIGPFALGVLLLPAVEIVLTKTFLGTPGKRLLGLRVLRLDSSPPTWHDCIQRQILWLVLVVTMSLQIGSVLPGMPSEFDQIALTKAIQDAPSNWALVSDFASAFLLASSLLVVFRPDHRSLQDIWAKTVVVRPTTA
jgi:uncharacterized RDD family membrane protein YckC